MTEINFITIIIAGLTTGGLTCFAVQGGLLTSVLAQIKKQRELDHTPPLNPITPTITFITTKLIAYTIVGAILGAFGSILHLSIQFQAIIQFTVALYMFGIALNFLNAHPIFKYLLIQPPKFLQRDIRKISKGNDEFLSPALLGLFTLVIPCGTTLAMEALAVSSGNPIQGALIMATFTLSTSWVFFGLGLLTTQINQYMQQYFYKLTAAALIVLAILTCNAGLNLLASPYSLDSLSTMLSTKWNKEENKATSKKVLADFPSDIQIVHVKITSGGYTTDTTTLQKGKPVRLVLETKNSYSCANAFTIPGLNIQKILPANGTDYLEFTPENSGPLVYSCSMGMYRGQFQVM